MPKKLPTQNLGKQSVPNHSVAMSHIPTLMGIFQAFKDKSEFSGDKYANLFPELKDELTNHQIADFDHLLDQLSRKFDFIFDDDDLPDLIKGQIARLQVFLFMSSMQENNLLKRSSNPARRLLDTIIRTEVDFSVRQHGERSGYEYLCNQIDRISNSPFIESSTYAALLDGYLEYTSEEDGSQHTVVEQFSPNIEPGPEINPKAKTSDKPVSVVEAVVQASSEPTAVNALETSKADNSENIFAVVQSIVGDLTMPLRVQGKSLILFDEVWSPLLLGVAHSQGFKSPTWHKIMTIAKAQVWVLTPKSTEPELQKLKLTMASIERSLSQSMQTLKLPINQQTSLFKFLEHEQADVIKHTKAAIKQSNKARKPATKKVTAKNKTSKVNLADTIDEFSDLMQTTGQFNNTDDMLKAINSANSAKKASTPPNADKIHKGDWIEIKKDNITVLAKLTWKSDDNSQFIFVDRDGNRICEIGSTELNKEMKAGTISLISSIPASSQRVAFSVTQTTK
ncbi:MAG: DUF1631 domain-containing protein [Gammaproteobacteria bacterium]|nr:DUF1631 domain-containing protein [Gammaproteobacteria bacterium]